MQERRVQEEHRVQEERRDQPQKPMSYYTHWVAILGFVIQLFLGAIAYGRLDGRVASIETEVHMLLERSIAK